MVATLTFKLYRSKFITCLYKSDSLLSVITQCACLDSSSESLLPDRSHIVFTPAVDTLMNLYSLAWYIFTGISR